MDERQEEKEIDNDLLELMQKYPEPEKFVNVLKILLDDPLKGFLDTGTLLLHVGNRLYHLSYLEFAEVSWRHALKYFIQNNDKLGECSCYNNLSTVYRDLGDYNKAIEYHDKYLKIRGSL